MSMQSKYMIFGASGGIGSCLARKLAEAGHALALSACPSEALTSLGQELEAEVFPADARDWEATARSLTQAREALDGLDGVAVCVGSLFLKPAHLTPREQWDEVLNVNLTAVFGILKASAKIMLTTGGSIALVSSAAAGFGMANHEAIAAAKAGVEGLTRSAAATYAPRGIRVNCVAPGLVETPLTAGLVVHEANRALSEKLHPLGCLGSPEDVASALAWFLDPAQAWVTGQVLGVDGGLSRLQPRRSVS